MTYQCDWQYPRFHSDIHSVRCSKPALMVFEKDSGFGVEHYYFCRHHLPGEWESFDHVYQVKDDELVELGVSKARRQPVEVTIGQPVPREFAREAVKRHWEKKQDILILHALGVRYDP